MKKEKAIHHRDTEKTIKKIPVITQLGKRSFCIGHPAYL
jgi:hypothetical protein